MRSPDVLRLDVPATPACRAVVWAFVESACDVAVTLRGGSADAAKAVACDLATATLELLENALEHGAVDDASRFELTVVATDAATTVEMREPGRAFDPAAIPRPDLMALPEGGMGLELARRLVDELEYRGGPPNVWRLTKRAERCHCDARELGAPVREEDPREGD